MNRPRSRRSNAHDSSSPHSVRRLRSRARTFERSASNTINRSAITVVASTNDHVEQAETAANSEAVSLDDTTSNLPHTGSNLHFNHLSLSDGPINCVSMDSNLASTNSPSISEDEDVEDQTTSGQQDVNGDPSRTLRTHAMVMSSFEISQDQTSYKCVLCQSVRKFLIP